MILRSDLDKLITPYNFNFPELINSICNGEAFGEPIHDDPNSDPDGIYTEADGLDLSSLDYKPLYIIRGIYIATAGIVRITWYNGSTRALTFTSYGDEAPIFLGYVKEINKADTTATKIRPIL